jgi:hypothetical protein
MVEEVGAGRSTEEIHRDLANEVENISRTIDQISERITEKLDWREQVKKSPYVALGAAAGIGYLAAKIFPTAHTPGKRVTASIPDNVRESRDNLLVGSIKAALLGVATKAAVSWIMKAASTSAARDRDKDVTAH